MESILKNQERLKLTYSILASELTDLQAKYDDSQMLLEQTTYMLKLEQLKMQQNHNFPIQDTSLGASPSSCMFDANRKQEVVPNAANKSKSASPVHKYLAQRDISENDSEIDPRDWIVPRPKTHTHSTLDSFCDLVYVDSTKNIQPSIVAKFEACKVIYKP